MTNDTDAAGTGRLRHQLLAGQRPDAAPLDEVAEVLAGGVPDRQRTEAVLRVLHNLEARNLLNLDDTGQKTYSPNPCLMWSFPLSSGISRQREAEDWRYGGSLGKPAPSQIPANIEHPVYSLQHCELLKAKPLLQAEALWPESADQWCGVETDPLLQKQLDEARVGLSVGEFKSLRVGACKLQELVAALVAAGHGEAQVSNLLDRKGSFQQHKRWLLLIKGPDGKGYYKPLALRVFELMLPRSPAANPHASLQLTVSSGGKAGR